MEERKERGGREREEGRKCGKEGVTLVNLSCEANLFPLRFTFNATGKSLFSRPLLLSFSPFHLSPPLSIQVSYFTSLLSFPSPLLPQLFYSFCILISLFISTLHNSTFQTLLVSIAPPLRFALLLFPSRLLSSSFTSYQLLFSSLLIKLSISWASFRF